MNWKRFLICRDVTSPVEIKAIARSRLYQLYDDARVEMKQMYHANWILVGAPSDRGETVLRFRKLRWESVCDAKEHDPDLRFLLAAHPRIKIAENDRLIFPDEETLLSFVVTASL